MDMHRLTPSILHNNSENSPESFASISDMISVGNQCSLQTSRRKVSTRSFVVAFSSRAIKWAIFVNRSTTTIIWILPCDSSSWVMKSVAMELQAAQGTCKDSSNSYLACPGDLLRQHSSQDRRSSLIQSASPFQ